MQKIAASQPDAKESRISVRINRARKAVIFRAARLRNLTLTDFVIENAFQAASQMLADQTRFQMTPRQFKQFCLAPMPPSKNLKAMRKLLNEPSVLDG